MNETEPLLGANVHNSATHGSTKTRKVHTSQYAEQYDKTPEWPYVQSCQADGDHTDNETAVYLTRWYILLVMSLTVALQNACWGTWGPIAQSAKAVYGWGTSMLALMINCGNIGVLTGLVPSGYIVHRYGLRVSLLLTTFFLTLSPSLRAIAFQPVLADILIGFGQFFAGAAGSLTQTTVALISETWFPSNERTTATTIGVLSNAVGGAAAFLLGPAIVSQPQSNDTSDAGNNTSITSVNDNGTMINISMMETEIRRLNLIEIGMGGVLFLMTLVYFPKKPKKPPSLSASIKRQNFKEGLLQVTRNVHFWRVNVLCGAAFAVFVNWLGLLNENLNHLNISQKQAGWYGFYAFAAGSIGGIIIGRMADQCQRRLKLFQLFLFGISTAVAVYITCMRNEYILHTHVLFGVSIAVLGLLMYTTFPLNIEFACETGYPVSEEIVSMCLGIGINATAVVFLLVELIPGIGINWINWLLVGILVLPVIFMITLREKYNRMDVDVSVNV